MTQALKLCAHPGCRSLVKGTRCEKHKARGKKNRSGDPFYSSKAWRQVRRERLRIEPTCRYCREMNRVREAGVVDHVLPRSDRPDLELEIDNTQSLCPPCHNRKTMGENQQRWTDPAE